MNTITIDNKVYELDKLSDDTKAQLNMLAATDQEIAQLNMKLAIAQTARIAYANAVNTNLPKSVDMSEVVVGNLK